MMDIGGMLIEIAGAAALAVSIMRGIEALDKPQGAKKDRTFAGTNARSRSRR